MGKALYRQYRSKKLSDVVGQEHVTTALNNALKNNKVGHAYLFTGPRGVGKTSVARILAHEVNNLPYDEDTTHLDIIEIDAASNRRIDEIRSLREKVHNAPASAKYKVYIIDEVHMLTKEAFNALLKTLEEPPAHVIFILATTEVHKLPETIISRTQRFTFKPAEKQAAIKHLRNIAKQEKIDISDEALELIAEQGNGSFRDSISALDQIRNTADKIDKQHVQQMLGIAPKEIVGSLLQAIQLGDSSEIINLLGSLKEQGFRPADIAKQLTDVIRTQVLEQEFQLSPQQSIEIMHNLLDVQSSHDPSTLLEITLLKTSLSNTSQSKTSSEQMSETKKTNPPQSKTKDADKTEETSAPKKPAQAKETQITESEITLPETKTQAKYSDPNDEATWQKILLAIKQQHNTLYSIARMGQPLFDDDKLILTFSFQFHQKRFNENQNKQLLSEIILQETGKTVSITCVLDDTKNPIKPANSDTKKIINEPLETISNIFGGGEVLE